MKCVTKTITALLLTVAALGSMPMARAQVSPNDPIAYWSFDNSENMLSNLVISTPCHDASVLFGEPTAGLADGAAGIVDNALVLDGATGIRLPYHQDNLGESFTISLWYWQLTNDTRQCVYQTRDNYTLTYEAMIGFHTSFASYVGQVKAGAITTELKEWIHLAHTFSTVGNIVTLSVYSNGVMELTKNVSSNSVFNANQIRGLHVGAFRSATAPANGRCFKGMIDELALWDRALSEDEVQAVYQRGISGQKLEFQPKASPVISFKEKRCFFSLRVADGLPDGMFTSGWLLNGIQDPAYPYKVPDTVGDLLGCMPDTAENVDGPFNAQIVDVKWRVPMNAVIRQLSQDDYTLETWFRTAATTRGTLMGNHSPENYKGVVNMELHGANNVRLYQRNTAGKVTDLNLSVANINTRDNQWHHLAGIRRGNTMALYLDGQEVGSTTTSLGAYALAGDYFYLGRDKRLDVAFNGKQGETRLWTRALTTNELTSIVATRSLKLLKDSDISKTNLLAEYALYSPFDATKCGWPGWYQINMTSMPSQLKQLPMTNFTCEAVFRTTVQEVPGNAVLMGNWSNNVYSAVNLQLEGVNIVRFYLRDTLGTVASLSVTPEGINTRDGNWHSLAGVRRGNTMALYLDGQLVGSQSTGDLDTYLLGGESYYLGRDGRNTSDVLVGDLGHARFWSRDLDDDELEELAISHAVPSVGLIAQYAPMLTNSLRSAGFQGRRFLRSFTTPTNIAKLVFTDLPRHNKIGIGLLLAQLDSLDPLRNNDHFEIRVDGAEVLSVGLGPNQGGEPQLHAFKLFGVPADDQALKNTMTIGGEDLFSCGTAWTAWGDYTDHVYDLAELKALQAVPHTADTLVLDFLGIHNATGEDECFGIDQIELTVYPLRGTLITIH